MKKVNFESPEIFFGSTGHPSFLEASVSCFFFCEGKIICTAGFVGDEFFLFFEHHLGESYVNVKNGETCAKPFEGCGSVFLK